MATDRTNTTRRGFLKTSTGLAVGATLAGTMAVPRAVHAGASETVRVGLIGCGGRGTAAAQNALDASRDNVLVAVGDAFADKAQASVDQIRRNESYADRVNVPDDHVFAGFDAYKQVIDSGVDVVILAEPPHFRPQHLAYAVEKGKHAFVEKPVAVDAPGVRSIIETCDKAKAKGLAIVSGLAWRYHPSVRETVRRIVEDKAIGDIVAIQSCYNAGTLWHRGDKPEWSRMEYQVRNWLYFDWLSGDHICEQAIHSLDKAGGSNAPAPNSETSTIITRYSTNTLAACGFILHAGNNKIARRTLTNSFWERRVERALSKGVSMAKNRGRRLRMTRSICSSSSTRTCSTAFAKASPSTTATTWPIAR
jgi:predicted dehydrogenase